MATFGPLENSWVLLFFIIESTQKKQGTQRCQKCIVSFEFSSLKPLDQFDPNLAGMLIGWSCSKLMGFLLIRSTQKKKEAQRCRKSIQKSITIHNYITVRSLKCLILSHVEY